MVELLQLICSVMSFVRLTTFKQSDIIKTGKVDLLIASRTARASTRGVVCLPPSNAASTLAL